MENRSLFEFTREFIKEYSHQTNRMGIDHMICRLCCLPYPVNAYDQERNGAPAICDGCIEKIKRTR